MPDGAPPNSEYLPPTKFYRYGGCIMTRLCSVTGDECVRVMMPERTYFETDNTLWSAIEYGDDDYVTVITAEEFAAEVKARGGSLEDIYPKQQ